MRRSLLLVVLPGLVLAPAAGPRPALAQAAPETAVAVVAQPLNFALLEPARAQYGRLEWRGGMSIGSDDGRFGGFSGFVLAERGRRLVAVSDRGYWLDASLQYTEGRLTGVAAATMGHMLDSKGNPVTDTSAQDAEALALFGADLGDGLMVGFERRTRVARYDFARSGFAARAQPVAIPPGLAKGPENAELEAIGRFQSGPHAGKIIGLSEANIDANGNIRGWMWKGPAIEAFAVRRREDYALTDLAILPGGDVLILERRLGALNIPHMAIRRLPGASLAAGAVVDGELLIEASLPGHNVDNMEGLALHRTSEGELRLTLLSDDNYNRSIQRTLILQFALPE